jgi:Tol biopolymer transport system component
MIGHEEVQIMKARLFACVALIAVFALALSGAGQQSAEQMYKSGLYEEEVGGDLQKAVGIYQDLLKRFPASREIAAKAQLHIGLCYEKLGTAEAEKAFQKVIDNYPEQSEAVREAREKLSLLLRSRAAARAGAAEFSTRRIWSGPEVDTEGDVTLDGRYLSFVDLATGDLAVRDLVAGTNRRLTHIDEKQPWSEFAMLSKWSRDGRRIAYQWYGKDDFTELRVIDLQDSSVRTIHRNKSPYDWAEAFDWTPDDRRVLAAFYLDVTPTQGRGVRVGLVSLEDGSVEMLKGHFETLLGTSSIPRGFVISPDGRFVAYDAPRTDDDAATRDIYLIAMDSGTESLLVDHPENDRVVAWRPDGKGLLFSSNRTGSEDLWILPMFEGTASDSPRMLKSGFGAAGTMGITARGDLYYGAGGNETDVYVVDLGPKQGDGRPAVRKLALPNQGRNQYPDYSPDGRTMAYLTTPQGRGRIISIFSQDTGRVQELALHLPSFMLPRWIPPDGQALSAWVIEKDGRRAICKVNVQTGESVPIASMDSGLTYRDALVWAKDGKRIFYTAGLRSDEKRYIYTYDLETQKHDRLRGSPEDACFIAVSPDGKWLAFVNEHGKKSLRIMPTSGGEPREVHSFDHPDHVITPAWSADGRSIYLPKLRDHQKNIWDLCRVPLDGSAVEKIDLGYLWVRYLTVSPDGRHIAFSSSGTERKPSEVWVMENFLPSAKK